jgi:hypothetical protein
VEVLAALLPFLEAQIAESNRRTSSVSIVEIEIVVKVEVSVLPFLIEQRATFPHDNIVLKVKAVARFLVGPPKLGGFPQSKNIIANDVVLAVG